MGRRAKKAPVQTKKRPTLSKRFKCPFCANEETVECKMDFRAGIGSLACRLCAASYQMPIHHLHEPVDVFSEWLDDCEAAAQGRSSSSNAGGSQYASASNGGGGASGNGPQVPQYDSEEDDNAVLPTASGLSKSSNNKSISASKSASASPNGKAKGSSKPSYTDLGLDDSDDDDSD